VTWDEDGRVFILGLWSTDDVVGRSLFESDHYQLECLSPVVAHPLPSTYHYQRSELLSYLNRTKELLKIAQMRSVGDRLIYFLEFFAHQFGTETTDGLRLNVHLTHQDIADAINSSRVTITRLMGRLHDTGFIRWQREKRKRFLVIHPRAIAHRP
jgi:CRP-like cAMP-binding protein